MTRTSICKALATLFSCATLFAQQATTQRTPWHVSTVFKLSDDLEVQPPGLTSGVDIATVPAGYNAVIEHISARCFTTLAIAYGEVVVYANPKDPGQSGNPGPPGVADVAHHPFLFQAAYSGSNVYVASQEVKLRVSAPNERLTFFGDFVNTGNASAPVTCLLSLSGYTEKQ